MARKPKSTTEVGEETPTVTEESSDAGGDSRGNGQRQSMSGFFRNLFLENPKLLRKRSNKEIFRKWLDAHPGHEEVPPQVKQAASNVKSTMKLKKIKRKGSVVGASAADNGDRPRGPRPSVKVLQSLEEQIDLCLSAARILNLDGLGDVIESLRRARNEVIVKQGKPGTV